ncbi:hypothetical protein ACER0A_006095 [Haloimpatiens sp. FM7315]|uniref:hypothetical protein n=1 Tax=Haloimpatiens sp. FM7315 TaxID=3298609 RepID=UPI0035A35EC0
MIGFKTMWQDVSNMILQNKISEDVIHIVETYDDGFIVEQDGENYFVNKNDFIDFWCKMLCNDAVSREELVCDERYTQKYVYDIVQSLPYVAHDSNTLRLMK